MRFRICQSWKVQSWIDADTLDISTTTAGVPADDDVRSALRTLLEDRFKLAAHRDTREFPVYALVKTNVDGAPRSILVH